MNAHQATRDPLLEEVEQFIRTSRMTPTAFGTSAVKDPRFVFDLREGREPRRATRQKVVAFIRSNSGTGKARNC